MDITPYVESLRADLVNAAEAGGPEIRAAAERLALSLDPAVRLMLLDALGQAAAEITSDLPSGSVEVRLKGREPRLFVDMALPEPPAPPSPPEPPAAPEPPEAEDGSLARITLRIPEGVKTRAEELAAQDGTSLNSWIVAVLRHATSRNAVTVDIDLSSLPFGPGGRPGRRMSGWI